MIIPLQKRGVRCCYQPEALKKAREGHGGEGGVGRRFVSSVCVVS